MADQIHDCPNLKGEKRKLMFYVPQNKIWPGHLHPYETVSIRIRTISKPEEKPPRENYQVLAVKGERHPACGTDLKNPCDSRQDLNLDCSNER